jgi:hypothetical protein
MKSSPLRLLNVHLMEAICSYPYWSCGPQSPQVIVARLMGLMFEPHVVSLSVQNPLSPILKSVKVFVHPSPHIFVSSKSCVSTYIPVCLCQLIV